MYSDKNVSVCLKTIMCIVIQRSSQRVEHVFKIFFYFYELICYYVKVFGSAATEQHSNKDLFNTVQ